MILKLILQVVVFTLIFIFPIRTEMGKLFFSDTAPANVRTSATRTINNKTMRTVLLKYKEIRHFVVSVDTVSHCQFYWVGELRRGVFH